MALVTETTVETELGSALAQCAGFRVDAQEGRVGFVAGVLPDALLVRMGLFSPRTVEVPACDVVEIRAGRRIVVLRHVP